MKKTFHANGKLLLTGEYFVLDGALTLALPTKLGQKMEVEEEEEGEYLEWESKDKDGNSWFRGIFKTPEFSALELSDTAVGQRLEAILGMVSSIEPFFLYPDIGAKVQTDLEFPKTWGLGTSSTLLYNLAEWAEIDPFELQTLTFGGSGYDIACAGANAPILYQKTGDLPYWENANFAPPFFENLYFVYLGKKQNSREGIALYREKVRHKSSLIDEISSLTQSFLAASDLKSFEKLLIEHEKIVVDCLKLPRAQALYFNDYWGTVKSLGAWGGDFVLVTSDRSFTKTQAYFNEKGFDVFIRYNDLILNL